MRAFLFLFQPHVSDGFAYLVYQCASYSEGFALKYLLVIDDRLVREDAFAQAEKIIKKLDRLETDLDSFHDRDQRLFSSWYDLTFRKEKQQITDFHDEYRRLSKFHNWMIVVAEMHHVSLPRAFAYLKQEEERYIIGTEQEKAEIEKLRLKRDLYIRREIEAEFGYDTSPDFDDLEDDEEDDPKKEEAPELKMIREMSDQKLLKLCRDRGGAFALLSMCLNYAKVPEDYTLLLKVWDATPPQYQLAFAKEYTRETGKSLPHFIEEIRDYLEGISKPEPDEEEIDESLFDEDFIRSSPPPPPRRSVKKTSGEEVEALKLLYRKLVRQLHPDLRGNNLTVWQKKMWERVQNANRRQDKKLLEKLFRMVLIRNQSLNDLTVSEILESRVWLKEEFENLSQEAHGLKKQPAWGFSRRKEYASLKKKLGKPFVDQLSELSLRVGDLKDQHQALEKMSQSRGAEPNQRRKRSNRRKKSPAKNRDLDSYSNSNER